MTLYMPLPPEPAPRSVRVNADLIQRAVRRMVTEKTDMDGVMRLYMNRSCRVYPDYIVLGDRQIAQVNQTREEAVDRFADALAMAVKQAIVEEVLNG